MLPRPLYLEPATKPRVRSDSPQMLLLMIGLVFASPLRLLPSPEATLQLLPTVQPGLAEVMVYDNTADLRAQLKSQRLDGIRKARATNMGGTWLISLILEKPDQSLQLQLNGATWTGTVVSQPPADLLLTPAPSLAELAKAPEQVHPCNPPHLPLSPLVGDDRSYGLDSRDFTPSLPRWTEAEPDQISWDAVDALRLSLFTAKEHGKEAERYYQLGALHRDLGHAREAAYYFGVSRDHGGDRSTTELQRAGALLASHQWDAARTAAWQAWRWGASDDAVLEILGIISLTTHNPNAGSTALVIAHTTARPSSLALAGALLLESSCPREAVPILRSAIQYLRHTDPAKASEARLFLVDALILSGQLENAMEVLGQLHEAELPSTQAGILRARNRLLTLLQQTPDKWASLIPGLNQARQGLDAESAETLFLLGQVQEWLGDDEGAIDTWVDLVDHHRELTTGEPARRLVASWSRRIHHLLETGKELEAVELHAAVWRPFLGELVQDPAPLIPLAAAYRQIGLQHRAMNVLGLAAEVEGRRQLDDQDTVLQIADLYLEMGHPDLATDALEVLRTRSLAPPVAGRAVVLDGRIAEAQGQMVLARQRWTEAAKNPTTTVEAQARIAILDAEAGNCPVALAPLATALDSLEVRARLGEGVLRTQYARCLDRTGNSEGGTVAAFEAASILQDPDSRRYAAWLSAQAAQTAAVPAPGAPLESDPPDIWTLLSREDQDQEAFEKKLADLQQ